MTQNHLDPFVGAVAHASKRALHAAQRKTFSHEYTTNEDFSRMVPEYKRLVLLGPTGAGKSALANTLSGWRFEFDETCYKWNVPEESLTFKTTSGTDSVTRISSFANAFFLGQDDKPFIVVDTPGHDDTDPKLIEEQAADLNMKLEAMQYVNLILVTHKDYQSNRLDPTTLEILKKVSTMFQKAGKDVWKHVVIGYTRVDQEARSWRQGMDAKKEDLKKKLKELTKEFPAPCEVDVPVLCFSSYQSKPGDEYMLGGPVSTNMSTSDKRPWSHQDSLEELWNMLKSKEGLATGELKVFDGLAAQLKKAVQNRDKWARIASARKDYSWTALVLGLVCLFLCVIRPGLLNYPGYEDEILYFTVLGWCLGFQAMKDWFMVTWDDYVIPKLGPSVREYFPTVDLAKYKMIDVDDLKEPALAHERRGASKAAEGS